MEERAKVKLRVKVVSEYFDSLSFEPLDLIAFRGSDFVSDVIAKVQDIAVGKDQFTHVGIVVTSELMPFVKEMEKGEVYVWESTYSGPIFSDGSKNIEDPDHFFGVQIRHLKNVVEGYTKNRKAKVALCKLRDNPWISSNKRNKKAIVDKVKRLHKLYGMSLYEVNPLGLLATIIPCLRPARDVSDSFIREIAMGDEKVITISAHPDDNIDHINKAMKLKGCNDRRRSENSVDSDSSSEDLEAFIFCSELVALIYKDLGMIVDVDPSNVLPMQLVSYSDERGKLVSKANYIRM